MSNSIYNKNAIVTKNFLKSGYLKNDPFFVVDVGASGGIEKPWNQLGTDLKAIAIDPLVSECQRLQSQEKRPMVRYENVFAVAEKPEDQLDALSQEVCDFYARSSSEEAKKRQSVNFIKETFNYGAEVTYSEKKVSLNELLNDQGKKVNFLKIDTDGYDICVLKGADKILNSPNLIAVMVECQFLGAKGPNANVFSNIERYLADFGFSVYNMELNKYSRHHLPSKFTRNLFAQTERGQITWADVLFIRDPLSTPLTKELAHKYVTLFELFNLQDCAAELLVERADLFDASKKEHYLELLAKQYYLGRASYKKALNKYNNNPEFYFPRNYTFDGIKLLKLIYSKTFKALAPYFSRSFKDKVKSIINYN